MTAACLIASVHRASACLFCIMLSMQSSEAFCRKKQACKLKEEYSWFVYQVSKLLSVADEAGSYCHSLACTLNPGP